MKISRLFLCQLLGLSTLAAAPISEIDSRKLVFFEKEIRPLLAEHCLKCHSAAKGEDKGGLVLDSQAGWMDGGDSGPALVPGKVHESLLIEAIEQGDPDFAMPPKYKLSEGEIKTLKQWVAMGAPDPRDGSGPKIPATTIDIEARRSFWSFQPVKNPELPAVENKTWGKDPLDQFVLAGIEQKGLEPVADADRVTLLRRATFDLVGLPPTPEEIQAFVNDPADDEKAFAKVVDRLIASKHFGERWGRHWLDVVRYGESMGRTRNYPFPFAWKYRDYVIDALNGDMPYNQFVVEQLAGDLLEADSAEEKNRHLIATGFLALGSMDLNERDREKYKMDTVDDQIDVTGRAFMALTTGCARCHDHKFDPIPTTDYYAMAGIFGSTDTLTGYRGRQGGGNKGRADNKNLVALTPSGEKPDAAPKQPTPSAKEQKIRKELAALQQETKELTLRMQRFKKSRQSSASKSKKVAAAAPAKFDYKKAESRLRQMKSQMKRLGAALSKEKKGGDSPMTGDLAMGVRDLENVSDCKLCIRGDVDNRGAEIPRGVPQVLTPKGKLDLPSDASGRLEMAQWMASPEHPLTARVMANRVWHHLFGRGIVRTVDNFGESGELPSHPELLDHLATRFSGEMNWSVKELVRMVVLSRSYRLASDHDKGNHAIDPGNTMFWRANARRLEAEALRDAMMHVAGTLDLNPAEGSLVQKAKSGEIGRNSSAPDVDDFTHRSVYLPIVRNFVPEFLDVFDFSEPASVIGRRDITTVSTQALYLLNDGFVIDQSRAAAKRVLTDTRLDSDKKKIAGAYVLVLGRVPTSEEASTSLRYLAGSSDDGQGAEEAWGSLMQALFASAEFRYAL